MKKDHITSALIVLLSTSCLMNEETALDDEIALLLHFFVLFCFDMNYYFIRSFMGNTELQNVHVVYISPVYIKK